LDSQGDVNLIAGRFREAEELYLEAVKKDPNFLGSLDFFKAAFARLMTGDIPGADALFERFAGARKTAKDASLPYRQAEWDWSAGRRKQAMANMEEIARANEAGNVRDVASRAYAQLGVWRLVSGDRAGATGAADRALATASQASAPSAYLARFLAQPDAPASEWEARAGRAFQNPALAQVKRYALSLALLLGKQFQAAAPIVRQVEEAGVLANDPTLPILRAWTLVETGNAKDAAAFLRWNPVPSPNGFGIFWPFAFPRLFYLRAAVAQTNGNAGEAKAQYRLFLQLSGNEPLLWGEEKKAAGR